MSKHTPRLKRVQVLVVPHADGYIEAYADNHVDVKIAHCPWAATDSDTAVAEDCVEMALPAHWRHLYFPAKVRASGNVRPLLPSVANEARAVGDLIKGLNGIESAHGMEDVRTWTL